MVVSQYTVTGHDGLSIAADPQGSMVLRSGKVNISMVLRSGKVNMLETS